MAGASPSRRTSSTNSATGRSRPGLTLCACKLCQAGPDDEVMKGPDHVEIGEAEGIVRMHDGSRDELRAGRRIATQQRQSKVQVSIILTQHNLVVAFPLHRERAVTGEPRRRAKDKAPRTRSPMLSEHLILPSST